MIKPIILFLTLVGLAPITFFSFVSLRGRFEYISALKDDSSVPIVISNSIRLGPSSHTVYLSTDIWPALSVFFGIFLIFIGAMCLFPKSAQKVYPRGLSKLEKYMTQIAESPPRSSGIVISIPDGDNAVSLLRTDQKTLLFVVSKASMETRIMSFFSKHSIKPISINVTHGNGTTDDISRSELQLSNDPKVNAQLVSELFTELFGADDSTALEFREMPL